MAQPEAQRASPLSRYALAFAVSAVAAALLLRYWRQDLCVFVLDEPKFLAAARAQLAQHQWLSASPLVGNKGLRYGPVFFWLEGLVVGTLGPHPAMMIAVVTTIVTVAHLTLAWGIARALRSGILPFVISAGLLAVSPCQFFWSRMAWDNPIVNACAAAVVVLLATRPELSVMTFALLGLILGIAAGTHMMASSLVVGVFVVLAWEGRHALQRTVLRLSAMAAVLAAVNLPYLMFLGEQQASGTRVSASNAPMSWKLALSFFADTAQIGTSARARYFFDGEWSVFLRWLGAARHAVPGPTAAGLLIGLALAGLIVTLLRGDRVQRRLVSLALIVWFGHALLCAWGHLDPHPHYQQPAYWVIPLGISCLAVELKALPPLYLRTLTLGLAGFMLVQLAFLERWMRFVDERGGTQGVHYSVPLGLQEDAVRRACSTPAPVLAFDNRTRLFPASIEYLASLEPACAQKQIVVCGAKTCPPPAKRRAVFKLRYAGGGGRLQ